MYDEKLFFQTYSSNALIDEEFSFDIGYKRRVLYLMLRDWWSNNLNQEDAQPNSFWVIASTDVHPEWRKHIPHTLQETYLFARETFQRESCSDLLPADEEDFDVDSNSNSSSSSYESYLAAEEEEDDIEEEDNEDDNEEDFFVLDAAFQGVEVARRANGQAFLGLSDNESDDEREEEDQLA